MTALIEPTPAQLEAFSKADQTSPIAMVNLLKFRDKAEYEDGRDAKGLSGRDAYGLYSLVALQKITEVGGRFFWGGMSEQLVIGDADSDWDMVAIVRYPTRAAFLRMIAMPDYLAASVHRVAGLARTAIVQCPGSSIPA
jgi:hypothetical protein